MKMLRLCLCNCTFPFHMIHLSYDVASSGIMSHHKKNHNYDHALQNIWLLAHNAMVPLLKTCSTETSSTF